LENPAKITLSNSELEKVMASDFFLTKQSIITSVYELFKMQAALLTNIIPNYDGFATHFSIAGIPKIYKGENYRGLPYVMMDYPSRFEGTDIFALRTFFWWGNHFSIHLLLKGKYKEAMQERIVKNIVCSNGIYTCVNKNAWQYNFDSENYVLTQEPSEIPLHHDFIKFGMLIPLHQWNNATPLFDAAYRSIGALLAC